MGGVQKHAITQLRLLRRHPQNNVQSGELEAVIYEHPAVREAQRCLEYLIQDAANSLLLAS